MKYNNLSELVDACYGYLQSNLLAGTRWGMDFHFYKPAQTKYGPHQWLWDSGWHMIVWSHREPENSIKDLRTMLQFQQSNGFIPEMIYWGERGFIERFLSKFVGYSHKRYTDISQMPMLAYSVRAIWNATNNKELLKEFVPKLVKYLEWWHNERDPDKDGLISIIHPWESGIDASPLYDPAHRVYDPTYKELYPKFLKLLWHYKRNAKWDQQIILQKEWFNMEDVGVCSVYADQWGVLASLAQEFDQELAAKCTKFMKDYEQKIIEKCWNEEKQQFMAFYHQDGTEKVSKAETIQTLFPLLLDDLPKNIQEALVEKIKDPKKFGLAYPIPSVAKSEITFNPHESRLLWRGPTWPSTTWFVMEGLLKHGYKSEAEHILDKWIEMYQKNGIYEYHNPLTGEGEGQEGLGMSMTIVDMLHRMGKI